MSIAAVVTDADVAAYLDVRNRVEPTDPVGEAGFRATRGRRERVDLVASLDGVPVGFGFVGRHVEDADSSFAFGKFGVLSEHRRRGVGTLLFRALSDHARTIGRRGLATEAREDRRDALDYLERRGFRTVLRAEEVALDVASADARFEPIAGVRIAPLTDASLHRPAYDALCEVVRDLPSVDPVVPPPFDEWRATDLDERLLRPCSFCAVTEDVVVGIGFVYATPFGGVHGLTGVRARFRRGGIAGAIKRAQIEAAKVAGLRELRASNEVANAAIRRLNERLGYRPLAAWLHLRGPLLPAE